MTTLRRALRRSILWIFKASNSDKPCCGFAAHRAGVSCSPSQGGGKTGIIDLLNTDSEEEEFDPDTLAPTKASVHRGSADRPSPCEQPPLRTKDRFPRDPRAVSTAEL